MKSQRFIALNKDKCYVMPSSLAGQERKASLGRERVVLLQPWKHAKLVDFQTIQRVLPNGLPNTTGILAVAFFRVGDVHIQVQLHLQNRKCQRGVKICPIFDFAERKWVSVQASDALLFSLLDTMMTLYHQTQGQGYVLEGATTDV